MTRPALNPVMAWDRLEPPQRAGDVAQRRPLTVLPLERLAVDVLLVVDDELPQAHGATLVWLERETDGAWIAWASVLDGERATPWILSASRLHLVRPDPSLLRLIGFHASGVVVEGAPRPLEPMPRQLSCICREKTAESAYRSAEAGWVTVDAVKRRTGALFGECQGRRCEALVARWLDLDPGDALGRMTPRPPLVPVPASVLAAFAGG
jgi:Sarcosine oxidase A3 domain